MLSLLGVFFDSGRALKLLLLLLNVFDDAPVCRHVKDESWARAVTWRTTEMQVSKDEYVMTV